MRRPLFFLLLLMGMGAALAYGVLAMFRAPGTLSEERAIVIPRGGIDAVSEALAKAGAIGSERLFTLAAYVTAWEGPLHAGEFTFPAHASLNAILAVLRLGRVVEHKLTIPEGLTASEIAQLLSVSALAGDVAVPREGGILPQTYLFEHGATTSSLVRRAESAMHAALAEAWRGRDADVALPSPAAMLTLASLVERETHLPAERALVARVFLNRLAHGMRLQSDPTTAYAASGGMGDLHRNLTHADLLADNPYNTYTRADLPPGPICSPGLASIEAVAHPQRSTALYFVADGSGGHVFSNSLAEHTANVAQDRH